MQDDKHKVIGFPKPEDNAAALKRIDQKLRAIGKMQRIGDAIKALHSLLDIERETQKFTHYKILLNSLAKDFADAQAEIKEATELE